MIPQVHDGDSVACSIQVMSMVAMVETTTVSWKCVVVVDDEPTIHNVDAAENLYFDVHIGLYSIS
jgi:hypothetical protein